MEDSTSQGDSVTGDGNHGHDDHGSGGSVSSSKLDEETATAVQDEPLSNEDVQPDTDSDSESGSGPDTFDRAYVEKLRQENGKYRQRAHRADELAHRLHRALVEATGRLQDPTDLPFDEDHLEDTDKLSVAIDELLTVKPHLAARRVTGDVGQGASSPSGSVDLLGLLRR